jgi:hypothetical protein
MHLSRFIAIVLCFILWITIMPLAISEVSMYSPMPRAEANAEPHLSVSNISQARPNDTAAKEVEPSEKIANATEPINATTSKAAATDEEHIILSNQTMSYAEAVAEPNLVHIANEKCITFASK